MRIQFERFSYEYPVKRGANRPIVLLKADGLTMDPFDAVDDHMFRISLAYSS